MRSLLDILGALVRDLQHDYDEAWYLAVAVVCAASFVFLGIISTEDTDQLFKPIFSGLLGTGVYPPVKHVYDIRSRRRCFSTLHRICENCKDETQALRKILTNAIIKLLGG